MRPATRATATTHAIPPRRIFADSIRVHPDAGD